MDKAWSIFEYMSGIAFIGGLGWLGYSSYFENNPPVDLAGPRSDACEAMARIGALDEQADDQCLTENAVYLSGLRFAIETRADRFQENMNEIVSRVSETASRLDTAAFAPMSTEHFFDIYEPFPMGDSANSALRRVHVDVERVTITAALEEDPDALPALWVRPDDMAEGDLEFSVDLDERVFEAMEYPFWFGCDEIVMVDDGCQGTLFVDLRSDGIMGETPVVIGFEMTPLTEEQATTIAFGLTAPHFSEISAEYDSARMKEVAEMF